MSSEPLSAPSQGLPPVAAERLNLAEQFASFGDYAASTVAAPQTAATSLDVARFHAFTGEMSFATEPAVRLYLDGGSVYRAECDGDPSVSRLILDAGVIDSTQLQRGVVSVGGVEHLGRLFDRAPAVDRDAVMVVVESATAALVQHLASTVTASVSAVAYRHHPSGIHRWFVAPVESTASHRPAGGVPQIDRSVVEELPRLGGPTVSPRRVDGSDPVPGAMNIEWSEPDPSGFGLPGHPAEAPLQAPRAEMHVDIQAELDRFDADRADWAAASGGADPEASEAVSSPLGEFRIVWPDGTRDESITSATDLTENADPASQPPASQATRPPPPAAVEAAPEIAPPTAVGPAPLADPTPVPTRVAHPPPQPPTSPTPAAAPTASTPVPATHPEGEAAPVAPEATGRPTEPEPMAPESFSSAPRGAETATPPSAGSSPPSAQQDPGVQGADPVGFTIEPLQVDQIPEPDAAVPDDVAAAVRRALQAIESASARSSSPSVPEMSLTPVSLPELSNLKLTAPQRSVASDPAVAAPATTDPIATPVEEPAVIPARLDSAASDPVPIEPAPAEPVAAEPVVAEPRGFEPPTAETRAEAVYERAAAEAAGDSALTEAESAHPEPGQASIVFVDEHARSESDRRGALRRLIGNLRNKD